MSLTWIYQDSIGYVASNRPGGTGGFDVYRVKYVYEPPVQITINGTIRDKETKEPVGFAYAILYKMTEDKELVPQDTFQTDQTGEYEFELEENTDYKIVANAPEFLANEAFVSTKEAVEKMDPKKQEGKFIYDLKQDIDILLKGIDLDEPIVLNNVYFDFDSSNIRPSAARTLDNLVEILKQNPNITIQLGAHTDTNGSVPYNEDLAERRAKSVVEYLVENGITRERLSWYGYGERRPLIYPELSDRDEQKNRRVEFRIKSVNYNQGGDS
jgi:outer membrane protein OmpA-like peptidoglycan-associated protein